MHLTHGFVDKQMQHLIKQTLLVLLQTHQAQLQIHHMLMQTQRLFMPMQHSIKQTPVVVAVVEPMQKLVLSKQLLMVHHQHMR
ncbi:MAG: hypothetical protein EBT79_10690 [Actinobacteria bacterium]|nr:hypothetical protein [Actinomycetota bacterium]